MVSLQVDSYGHTQQQPGSTLPCIALANSPSATVGIGPLAAGGTGGAGAGSTTTYVGGTGSGATAVDALSTRPNDTRGQFILTAAGTPVAGLVAQVNFAQPYAQPIGAIVVSAIDITASPAVSIDIGAVMTSTGVGTTTGFQLVSTPALTAAHNYQVNYHVIA
jgi:hypothetical protein